MPLKTTQSSATFPSRCSQEGDPPLAILPARFRLDHLVQDVDRCRGLKHANVVGVTASWQRHHAYYLVEDMPPGTYTSDLNNTNDDDDDDECI